MEVFAVPCSTVYNLSTDPADSQLRHEVLEPLGSLEFEGSEHCTRKVATVGEVVRLDTALQSNQGDHQVQHDCDTTLLLDTLLIVYLHPINQLLN